MAKKTQKGKYYEFQHKANGELYLILGGPAADSFLNDPNFTLVRTVTEDEFLDAGIFDD